MIKFPGWGQRNNESPPDLDEVMRDLSRKINNLFGKKRGPSNHQPNNNAGGNASGNITMPIIPIIAIVALLWVATGFYIVDQGSLGVVQRFGKFHEMTESGPRWHLPFPLERVTVVNMEQVRRLEVGYRSLGGAEGTKSKVPKEALMLTEDENIIELQFAVQYNLKNAKEYLFNNRDTDAAVASVAETAIREVVGKNKLDDLLQKGLADTSDLMQAILDNYSAGVNVISVSLQSALPPEQVLEAFEDVNRANQDNQRQINEGQGYANDVIPKARGTASRLIAESAGYKLKIESEARGNTSRFDQILAQYNNAPEVTRQRLFLDAQESILSSVSKIVVDQKAGNSMLYLPLDKLINATGANVPRSSQSMQSLNPLSAAAKTAADTERTREAFRSRDREIR